MRKTTTSLLVAAAGSLLAGCGQDAAEQKTVDIDTTPPAVTFEADKKSKGQGDAPVKPLAPVSLSYRIIGEPIVGRPVLIDMQLTSAMGTAPVKLDYRIPDATALVFPEDQLESITLAPPQGVGDAPSPMSHQVSVVPQREGRLYLNVSAEIETPEGPMSTVTAIPLQVGSAPRQLEQNGTVIETEEGELIRSMPASEQ